MSEARTELGASPHSPRIARDFLRHVMDAWGCDDPDDVAVLLTSEIVSNAVLHAATALSVEIQLEQERLRVAVRDGDLRMPTVQQPAPEDTSGRGLLLVRSLADRWGAERDGHGKVVWFEIRAGPRPAET
jgi:anti-sigma regulatory factor (Ser/Thr protein kinase)